MAQNGPFSDAFTDAFNNTDVVTAPGGNQSKLRHFRAKFFSGLRHFYAVHFLGVEIEVIITPTPSGGGGTGPYVPIRDYEIIVRIKRKDQVWEASYTWSKYFAEPAITILAKLSAFRAMVQTIIVRVIGNKVNTKDKVDVTVKKL